MLSGPTSPLEGSPTTLGPPPWKYISSSRFVTPYTNPGIFLSTWVWAYKPKHNIQFVWDHYDGHIQLNHQELFCRLEWVLSFLWSVSGWGDKGKLWNLIRFYFPRVKFIAPGGIIIRNIGSISIVACWNLMIYNPEDSQCGNRGKVLWLANEHTFNDCAQGDAFGENMSL